MKQLQIELRRAQYGAHLSHQDEAALLALLQTLQQVQACHHGLSAHIESGQGLEQRLLLVRQWAISNQRNRLRMNAEAVLNVVAAYNLDARFSR